MMSEMGCNVVRIYTIHPPHFYEALVEFNRKHPETPLYFIQGIWSPEEQLIARQDAFDKEIVQTFLQEIALAVQAVYGEAEIPEMPGKASGKYTVNAGPYLLAWHIGTEWDPMMVQKTNELHAGRPRYQGEFFAAKADAAPFESWLAEMLDQAAREENRFGWQHPITFTNWVTTDPLTHPGEPTFEEDMVSVDATKIENVNWGAGYFASYHVYPYYPDFFRLDTTLRTVTNEQGQPDPYKAYLRKLKAYHAGMPLMVTEFGVPSSLGIGHLENLGRTQGGHTEEEQGRINAELFETIVAEKYAGAILFSWQDEWFKKTWNTMEFEVSDRRAYWLNELSNEQKFGVIHMGPSKDGVIVIDGKADDWRGLPAEETMRLYADHPLIHEMWAAHDEAYLYLLLDLKQAFSPREKTLYIGVDTLPGGNRHASQLGTFTLDEGLEILVSLGDERDSMVYAAANYDIHTRVYGKHGKMFPVSAAEIEDNSGIFKPWKLAVGLLMEPPDTKVHHPFEEVVVGKMIRGTNDPAQPDFNSLAMWQAGGNIVEARIPWALLGFSDPSTLQVIGYEEDENGIPVSVTTPGIRLLPWMRDNSSGEVSGLAGRPVSVKQLPLYTWELWNEVQYTERKKQSYDIMKEAFIRNREHWTPPDSDQ
jgi:hypothetical protein